MGDDETRSRRPSAGRHGAPAPESAVEERVRAALARMDRARALDEALTGFGAEIFGFMTAVTEEPRAARAAYASFEGLVSEHLATFTWGGALRTWMYRLARVVLRRSRETSPASFATNPSDGAVAPPPFGEQPYRRTDSRSMADALRRALRPEDREILILRVDRRFSWRQLAITQIGEDATTRDTEREAARLRKRFQVVRQQLTRRAIRHGIIGPR